MAVAGYQILHETKTLDANTASVQGRSIGVPENKVVLSAGYADFSGRTPVLAVAYDFFNTDGGNHSYAWGFSVNDSIARSVECYVIVADA